MLEFENICKNYRVGPTEVPVLRGISLRLAAGELCAIMGGSGSGNTTFMNIVGLLDKRAPAATGSTATMSCRRMPMRSRACATG
jgi:ABC-type lipoprotein export system ATPase subunit